MQLTSVSDPIETSQAKRWDYTDY